jgi:ClpP class serine protease
VKKRSRPPVRIQPKGPVALIPKAWGADFPFSLFATDDEPEAFTVEGAYAVVTVAGPLCQKADFWGGCDTYDAIRERLAEAFASDAEAVCLRIDSPGGDYAGALERARDIREMSDESGKPLVAFTDSQALSAGYAIACAADEVVGTPSAQFGSVGVWAPLVDITAQDRMVGAKIAIIASGSAKADRNPHVPMTEASVARLQASVDEQALLFFTLVSEMRGVSVSAVRALDGADVFGKATVAAGLCDRIVNSWPAFLSEGIPMAKKVATSQASKIDEAMGILHKAAEEGDEDEKKKAKKMLKAVEEDGGEEKKEDEEEAKAKAAEEEKRCKAKAEEDKKKDEEAKAMAASNLSLAREVQELKAAEAARSKAEADAKETAARAALFAKRPDFPEGVRKALARVPLADLEEAVKSWPRASADPNAAASAMTPGGTQAVAARSGTWGQMSAEEQEIMSKLQAPRQVSKAASAIGTALQMPRHMDTKLAADRAEELAKELGL